MMARTQLTTFVEGKPDGEYSGLITRSSTVARERCISIALNVLPQPIKTMFFGGFSSALPIINRSLFTELTSMVLESHSIHLGQALVVDVSIDEVMEPLHAMQCGKQLP